MKIMYKKGFTLIELLVVITLLGILATFGVYSLSGAQEKARDASRKSDIKAIQTALELYYSDNNMYPAVTGVTNAENSLSAALVPTYLKEFPRPPKYSAGANEYSQYNYDNTACPGGGAYRLWIYLENEDDQQGTSWCGQENTAPLLYPGGKYVLFLVTNP